MNAILVEATQDNFMRESVPPPELVELLAGARAWSVASQGAFDVTVGPLVM